MKKVIALLLFAVLAGCETAKELKELDREKDEEKDIAKEIVQPNIPPPPPVD